jgi:hypothetical protein
MSLGLERVAPNFVRVDIGLVSFWFSFGVCVAFSVPGGGLSIAKGDWSKPTYEHLSMLCTNGSVRHLEYPAFLLMLASTVPSGIQTVSRYV